MKTSVSNTKSLIAFFETHAEAEQAITTLNDEGYDMQLFSIIAMNLFAVENVKGYYTKVDTMKKWGQIGAFYGGFWGLVFAASTFSIPFFGPILIGGPLTTLIVTLVCALIVGTISALGAALLNTVLHKKHKIKLETEIKAGKYMLITQGDDKMVETAREILEVQVPKAFSFATEWDLSKNKLQDIANKKTGITHLRDQ